MLNQPAMSELACAGRLTGGVGACRPPWESAGRRAAEATSKAPPGLRRVGTDRLVVQADPDKAAAAAWSLPLSFRGGAPGA
ncbi:MAG: hypothetical protein OEU93_10580 [Rubrivivax sp.]|nr:hypothetical protein [Rubrivivax sp.]